MLCSERQQLSSHPGGITRTTNRREKVGLWVNLGVLITHSSSGVKLHVRLGTTTVYNLVTGSKTPEDDFSTAIPGSKSTIPTDSDKLLYLCLLHFGEWKTNKKNLHIMSKEKSSKQIPNVTLLLFIRLSVTYMIKQNPDSQHKDQGKKMALNIS